MAVGQKQMARQVRMNIVNEHIQRAAEFLQHEENKKWKKRENQERAEIAQEDWHRAHPGNRPEHVARMYGQAVLMVRNEMNGLERAKKDVKKWEAYRSILRIKRASKREFKNLERKIRDARKYVKWQEKEVKRWEREEGERGGGPVGREWDNPLY